MPYPKGSYIVINYQENLIGAKSKDDVKCSSNL
jgi:hypothetical protein